MCVPGTKKKKIGNKLLLWPAALYNIGLQKLAATAAQKSAVPLSQAGEAATKHPRAPEQC